MSMKKLIDLKPFPLMYPATMSPSSFSLIEPLESRIAPAGLIIKTGTAGSSSPTVDNKSGETDYVDSDPAFGMPGGEVHFVNMSDPANAGDSIVQVVGNAANTYYIKLFNGDRLQVDAGGSIGLQDFISGPSGLGIKGNLVAFFVDGSNGNPQDNEVQTGELTGIALGKSTSVVIGGIVHGDIVSNYNDLGVNIAARTGGKLGGSAETSTATDLLLNPITSLVVSGDVTGHIISGGNISAVKVVGNVPNIFGGTAANGVTYDFNGSNADGGDTLAVGLVNGKIGVSLSNVNVVSVTSVEAGAGGAGAAGGALTGVNIINDTNGFSLKSGNGGDGNAVKTSGGAGGKISTVLVTGFNAAQTDTTANDAISILGGKGGDAMGIAANGLGGSVTKVYVGYDSLGGKTSVNTLQDTVLVQGGQGGSGKIGAAGGALSDIHLFVAPSGGGNDIQVLGGAGGDNLVDVSGSKAGAGGAILTVEARNINDAAGAAQVIVKGGAGGATINLASGGAGGAVTNAKILGFNVDVEGGTGSNGNLLGGAGGAVKTLTIEDFKDNSLNGIQAQTATVLGGAGGSAANGKGGIGGGLIGVTVLNADFSSATIGGGDGGTSGKGVGAAGGGVTSLMLSDIALIGGPNTGTLNLSTGIGGDGTTGGGGGGAFTTATIQARDLALNATTGNGGSVTGAGKGNGGAAGKITGFAYATSPMFDSLGAPVFDGQNASLVSGMGGGGLGTGVGGFGGDMKSISIISDGSVVITGGAGGDAGATGAAGKGASISSAFALSRALTVDMTAGAGGTDGTGTKAGAGGSIASANLRALATISVIAGDGTNGGAGGSLKGIGFTNPGGLPTSGSVTLQAGNVTGTGLLASAGGSITGATGFVGTSGTTLIKAGTGGATATKTGAGGSVTGVKIYGGGGAGAVLNIEAGDAVDATMAKAGGVGGSVKNTTIGLLVFDPLNPSPYALDTATVFHHVAAGRGGNTSLANGKGGLGGSIDALFVNHDIGVRSGAAFGFDATEMGGIFAGSGGINTTVAHSPDTLDKLDGAAGNVTRVSADAIASIVAGRPTFVGANAQITKQNLVTKVDSIILNGLVNTRVTNTGMYKNFDTANLVGGNHSANPNATANADTFDAGEYTDTANPLVFGIGDSTNASTDGFIAALQLARRNFVPEALLTVDTAGASVFVDYNHTNGQPS